MDERLLIAVVKKHPVIYDRAKNHFKDSVKRKNAWDAISKTLNVSAHDCMRLWKNVRERYAKELKLLRTALPDADAVNEPKWHLFDSLSFLQPYIKARRRSVKGELTGRIDEILLIEMVKRYPYLYDKYCVDHKNSIKKEYTWDEIADTFSVSADDCMRVWRNMRERYSKERKRMRITGNDLSSWNLFESLSFLEPHIRHRTKLLVCNSSKLFDKDSGPEWDGSDLVVNHEGVRVGQEYTRELEFIDTDQLADTPGPSPSSTFLPESPTIPEDVVAEPHRRHDHDYSAYLSANSSHASDMVFGNYVGQYLSEITDVRKKKRCILSIMQILHDDHY